MRGFSGPDWPMASSEETSPRSPRVNDDDDDDDWTCPVCLNSIESVEAKSEFVVLSCKHKIHLSCWLPCALPIGGGGTAQERYIEDRMGRKCPMCRNDFSAATTSALKPRREVIRDEERHDKRDKQLFHILQDLEGRGQAHPALAANVRRLEASDPDHGEQVLNLEQMRAEPMPIDNEQLFEALTNDEAVNEQLALSKAIRSALQIGKQTPSGSLQRDTAA